MRAPATANGAALPLVFAFFLPLPDMTAPKSCNVRSKLPRQSWLVVACSEWAECASDGITWPRQGGRVGDYLVHDAA